MMGLLGIVSALVLIAGAWAAARSGWQRGGRADFFQAAYSAGPAALASVLILLLARALGALAGYSSPFDWVGIGAGSPTDPAPALEAFFRLSAALSFLSALVFVLHAFVAGPAPRPSTDGFGARMPLASLGGLFSMAAGLTTALAFVASPIAWQAAGLGVDLAALGPVLGLSLGIRYFARLEPVPASPAASAPSRQTPQTPPPASAGEVLKKKGILTQPLIELPARKSTSTTEDALTRAWRQAGGTGDAPAALRTVCSSLGPGGEAHLVGDVPVPTEDALLKAVLIHALCELGERALVIGDALEARRDALREALSKAGHWPSGPLVAGGSELERSLAAGLVPAVVFLDLDSLSRQGRLFASPEGRAFTDSLALLLLPAVDAHPPIEATHLQFSMKRLSLLWWGGEAPSLVATGGSTPQARRFVEELVGRRVRLLPAGLEATSEVRVLQYPPPASGRTNERESLRKVLESFAGSSLEVVVEDPNARLSVHDIDMPELSARLSRTPSLQGDLSLSLVDDGWIARLYRQSKNLLARAGAEPGHTSLWWVTQSPLSRFLLQPHVLSSLERSGELPTPRPVAGKRNRWLAAAHLEAALAEGAHEEQALRSTFGDEAVNERLALEPPLQTAGHRARLDENSRKITRSPVWRPPAGQRWSDPQRSTVTRDVIEVVDERSGRVLATVDRRLAPTRFHPLRVFGDASGRYQVPAEAWSGPAPRGQLPVRPADERAGWTRPRLELELNARPLEDEPVLLERNGVSLAVASLEVEVKETVRGARSLDASATQLSFAPVSSTYPTRVSTAWLAWSPTPQALFHLAKVIDALLPAHLRVSPEDVEVLGLFEGIAGIERPALVFVDRHLGGMGVAEALDAEALHDLLRWARGVLFHCPCMDGCANCTPGEVLQSGADKQGVLAMLGNGSSRASA